MRLPEEFVKKMQGLMGEEFNSYLESYKKPRFYGLRVNTLKISVEEFLKISPFHLEPVPWTTDGFYYQEGDNPGRHPYYYAGLYYIQEPSAMLPGAVIGVKPGDKVLDLCAAPGGKTVQMAAQMKGQGLLIANDVNADRVKALVKNIELCGVRNAVVINETPDKLAKNFEGYFDKILVDAPCSGEGMFRKDEDAIKSWEKYKCEKCSGMQWDILQQVDKMLKPGGSILYSTCTFSPEEDELMIEKFLNKHEGCYELLEIPKVGGIEGGRSHWSNGTYDFSKAARLWPHKLNGEGHFAALIKKLDKTSEDESNRYEIKSNRSEGLSNRYEGQNNRSEAQSNRYEVQSNISEGQSNRSEVQSNRSEGLSNISEVQSNRYEGQNNRSEGQNNRNNDENNINKFEKSRRDEEINSLRRWEKSHVINNSNDLRHFNPELADFIESNTSLNLQGHAFQKGNNIYHLPENCPDLSGLKVAKFGWYLGEMGPKGFIPSHSLAVSLCNDEMKNKINFAADSRETNSYLKGETLIVSGEKGYTGICVDGYSLGWAKQTGDMLKNLYPKGWRKMS